MKIKVFLSILYIILWVNCLWATEKVDLFTVTREKGVIDFYANNAYIIPTQINIRFPKQENYECSVTLPYSLVLPANSMSNYLFTFTRIDVRKTASYNVVYNASFGDIATASHNNSYLYTFPFEHGTKFKLSQGYFGKATHQTDYALDFMMPEGTPIVAARDGLVFDVKIDSKIGGPSPSYGKYGNYIYIYHDDGSTAKYVHLRYGGSTVKIGDRVRVGDLIGYSGNTGYSSGPHLHFQVDVPDITNERSIPTQFLNYNGKAVEPREGYYYCSSHRGKPAFEVVFGADLKDSDFDKVTNEARDTAKFEVQTKTVDDTVLFFAKNGEEKAYSLTYNLKSQVNIRASKSLPLVLTIPPKKEIYLFMLNPVNPAENYSYRTEYIIRPVSLDTRDSAEILAEYERTTNAVLTGERLNLHKKESEEGLLYYARNGEDITYEMTLNFKTVANTTFSKAIPLKVIVPPKSEIFLLEARPKDPYKSWGYKTDWNYREVSKPDENQGAFSEANWEKVTNVVRTGEKLNIVKKETNGVILYFARNGEGLSYRVTILPKNVRNVLFSRKMPYSAVVPSKSEIYLFMAYPKDEEADSSFNLSVEYEEYP